MRSVRRIVWFGVFVCLVSLRASVGDSWRRPTEFEVFSENERIVAHITPASSRLVRRGLGVFEPPAFSRETASLTDDVSDTLLRKFVYGPGIDEPICMIDVTDNNAVYYYHFDPLGSIVVFCDANGMPVEKHEYDVFGEPTLYGALGIG